MSNSGKCTVRGAASVVGLGLMAGAVVYGVFVRRWHLKWGASSEEIRGTLPGDGIVARPNMNSTRAVTVNAEPSDIWPWLVQMGKGRGGLYSYDWLDIAFHILENKSIEQIMPEYQDLQAGDTIPLGSDEDPKDDFYVHIVDPNSALVIGSNHPDFIDKVSWAIVLQRVGPNRTRLIMRVRASIPMDPKGIVLYALMDPATFVMLRKQMLNLKRLGERTRMKRESHEFSLAMRGG
jgi:hypothetical protein